MKKILKIRNNEIGLLRKDFSCQAWLITVTEFAPYISVLACVFLYTSMHGSGGQELGAIYAILMYLEIFKYSAADFSITLVEYFASAVSVKRVSTIFEVYSALFDSDENSEDLGVEKGYKESEGGDCLAEEGAVVLREASFSWVDPKPQEVLKKLVEEGAEEPPKEGAKGHEKDGGEDKDAQNLGDGYKICQDEPKSALNVQRSKNFQI